MSFTATVENDIIKLPPGVHLPDGTKVTVEAAEKASAPQERGGTFAERYAEFMGILDGPEDLAERHDHYASGAPKPSK